ncbi:Importin-5 like [Actinidia chinensis var. chinensis]|uniref:Importin-5 like n=1 Tax=Actinidia chinensis var. chinensis TaxID=1590841 RepID=A0A2R6QSZ3_ACTCC|nr:Importin-5 like [Actinidia chinensis var. chinensis]
MGLQHRAPVAVHSGGRESPLSGWLGRIGGCDRGQLGGFSHESENDLGILVRDFIENGSCGNESWYSSDSDSGSSDLALLADKILLYKNSVDQYECDLVSVVHSLILSINETNYPLDKSESCEHEFIDVINHFNDGCSERFIIDIDFCSHFEIARAVQSYDAVLRALPLVFVGSTSKLKQFLQAMEEAARASLK